jgi:hypothetical protein
MEGMEDAAGDAAGEARPRPGEVTERVVQVPCGWCSAAIPVNHWPGRRRRYCTQSCRQRAYELRTAAARYGADLAAGRIAVEPAERVIERTVLAPYPTRPADWIAALEALAEQLRSGQLDPAQHDQLRLALQPVLAALDSPVAQDTGAGGPGQRQPRPGPTTPDPANNPATNPASDVAGDRVAREVLACLPDLTGRTSLERMAAVTGYDPDTIRDTLTELADAGAVTVYRQHTDTEPTPIDPYALSPHAGFHITLAH